MDQKEKIAKLKKLYKANEQKVKYLLQFSFVVVVYGCLLTFVLSQLLSTAFTIKNILAYGIVAYIIKAELPTIILGCFPKKPPIIQS